MFYLSPFGWSMVMGFSSLLLIILITFLLQNLLKLWRDILRITKAIAHYIFQVQKGENSDSNPEYDLLLVLFGEKERFIEKQPKSEKISQQSPELVFRLITDLTFTWLLIGILYLVFAFLSGMRY